jgi:hypothetical protein
VITLIVSKWRPFSFYLHLGKQRKEGCIGDDSHVVFGQNSLMKKNVRVSESEMVHCNDATANSFVATVVCGIDCLVFQNNLLEVKENDEHAFDFVLHLSRVFIFTSLDLSHHCQGFRLTFSEIFTKCDAVPLLDPS